MILLLAVVPKNPTTTSPATVVVTEGAAKKRFLGVNAPLCESMGADESTPLAWRIAPAADTAEGRVQL
mgnify:CR=1 FL=1